MIDNCCRGADRLCEPAPGLDRFGKRTWAARFRKVPGPGGGRRAAFQIGVCLAWSLGASNVSGAEAAVTSASWTLAAAQQAAFERNWDLLAAAVGVDAATAQQIVAHEFPNPTFSFSPTKISVDDHPNSTIEGNGLWQRSYDTFFAVNQLLEIGGKRRSRQVSAAAGYESARALFYDAKRTLDLGVTKAYVAAALAEENSRVLAQSASTLEQESKLAAIRLRSGEISSSDKDQIDVTAERFELDARTATAAAAQARVALQVLLGEPKPDGLVTLTDSLETLCSAAAPGSTNSARFRRPDVMAAEAALKKTEADLRLQKAYRIPDPTLQLQYEHEPPDLPNTIGVGVSLPIPLWNRNKGNILSAQAIRDQARLALSKAEAQAAADLATARLGYDESNSRWQNYRDSVRPKSESIRKTLTFAYQKGGASLLDLLLAERNDNDVRLAAAQAAADTASALAALRAALVELPQPVKK